MQHIADLLVPVSLFLSMGFVFYKYFMFQHTEKMAMIDKGLSVMPQTEPEPKKQNTNRIVTWGMLAVFVGLGMILGLILNHNMGVVEEIIPAIMICFGGVGLLSAHFLNAKEQRMQEMGQR